jgi:nitrite reductase/ring-hydroxylating ferredoxin subunit
MLADAHMWFAVARAADLPARHVAQAMLLGQELALWRDDAGRVNAWENRCPHRGVRLSIGANEGAQLACRYHGWRFDSVSGACRFIPAQPELTPPATLRARIFKVAEAQGLVWVSLGEPPGQPGLPGLCAQGGLVLRGVWVEAPAEAVLARLPDGAARIAPYVVAGETADGVYRLQIQPGAPTQCVIHGVAAAEPPVSERLAMLRRFQWLLAAMRDQAEARL